MDRKIKQLGLVLALTGLGTTTAFAQTLRTSGIYDGRLYEIYDDTGTDWESAKTFTETLNNLTVQGRLATITSFEEDDFIRGLAKASSVSKELWVGGFQESGSAEPDEGWVWLNGELIPAPGGSPGYENWETTEPNNLGGEHHLGIGLGGDYNASTYGWNDEQNLSNIGGFVVEYGDIVEVDPAECLSPGGCATLPDEAQTLLFPPGTTIVPGVTVAVRTFEFIDELHNQAGSRCGVSSRTLFGPTAASPLDEFAEVVMPAWLCGSPRFLIVFLATTGVVETESGTVVVENEPLTALEDNLYECVLAPGDQDLRHRDVVGWQSTFVGDMVEHRFRAANPSLFSPGGKFEGLGDTNGTLGTMGEYLDGCASSRGRVKGSSYHAIGVHIHPADTSDANLDFTVVRFVELIQYKLALLDYSVLESRGVLDRNGFRTMKRAVGLAIRRVGQGNFSDALSNMNAFMQAVDQANYNTSAGNNENGEHLSRGANIILMLEEDTSLPTP